MKANNPTKEQRKRWELIRASGCLICGQQAEIHHCFTKMGTRKNHDHVIPLCYWHHRSNIVGLAIHSGKRLWEEKFGTERDHLNKTISFL